MHPKPANVLQELPSLIRLTLTQKYKLITIYSPFTALAEKYFTYNFSFVFTSHFKKALLIHCNVREIFREWKVISHSHLLQ